MHYRDYRLHFTYYRLLITEIIDYTHYRDYRLQIIEITYYTLNTEITDYRLHIIVVTDYRLQNTHYTLLVFPSGSVFTEKLCIQSFLENGLCNGSVKASKLAKSLYFEMETTRNITNLLLLWFLHPSD